MTWRELLTTSLQEIGVYGPGETPSAADINLALNKGRRLINRWNAQRCAVYAQSFETFVITPSLSPHTIGPTVATWTVTQRPVTIESADLVITSNIRQGITIRGPQWWAAQSQPDLTSTIPTDVYYQPDWPNGKLFFWPVPTTAYSVELQVRVLLSAITLDTVFSLPPGYEDAITLTIAEMCSGPFRLPITPDLRDEARRARAVIFDVNDPSVSLITADYGMTPGDGGSRADFNFLTGRVQ